MNLKRAAQTFRRGRAALLMNYTKAFLIESGNEEIKWASSQTLLCDRNVLINSSVRQQKVQVSALTLPQCTAEQGAGPVPIMHYRAQGGACCHRALQSRGGACSQRALQKRRWSLFPLCTAEEWAELVWLNQISLKM